MLYTPASLQSALRMLCMLYARTHCHPALSFYQLMQEAPFLNCLGLKCELLCSDSPNHEKLCPFLFVFCARHLPDALVSDVCSAQQLLC